MVEGRFGIQGLEMAAGIHLVFGDGWRQFIQWATVFDTRRLFRNERATWR